MKPAVIEQLSSQHYAGSVGGTLQLPSLRMAIGLYLGSTAFRHHVRHVYGCWHRATCGPNS